MKNQDNLTKPCSVVLEQLTPQKQLALSAELKQVINERNMLTTRTRRKVIEALDEIGDNTKDKTRTNKKNQAVEEILESEVSYLKQLERIIKFFKEPIQERKLLSEDDFRTLFGNIETIYNVNGELLEELKGSTFNVAKAFRNMAPYFKLYSIYAYDYKSSLNILQRAEKERGEFIKFVKAQETRPEVQSKLTALLIAPIQRIPRYRLLLKQVLEYTMPDEEDYLILVASVRRIEEVARHINSLVEDHENTHKMLTLQRCLLNQKPNLIKPGRKIIKEGVLNKLSRNGSHYKRYFVLMNDILMFCKMKSDDPATQNALKCSGILPLNKCKVTEVLSKGCFKINCQDEEVIAYHDDFNEGREWVRALRETVKGFQQNRQTLRKESSQRRPAKRKQVFDYEEPGVSPGRPMKRRHVGKRELTPPASTYKSMTSSGDAPEAEKETWPVVRILRRRMIRCSPPPEQKKLVPVAMESTVYPMRTHDIQEETEESVPDEGEEDKDSDESRTNTDVYVFGAEQNGGFSNRLGVLFRGIRNSVKTMFGMR